MIINTNPLLCLTDSATVQQLKNVNLPAFISQLDSCEVRSLEDIIAWNNSHADLCLPPSKRIRTYSSPMLTQGPDHRSQHELTDLVENKTTAEEYAEMAAEMRKRGCDALDPLFERVDILVAFADSPLCMYTSASGQSLSFSSPAMSF